MARIALNNEDELVNTILSKKAKSLGFGGDGECYLNNDGYVYKVMNTFTNTYNSDAITQEEINSDLILFPEDIFLYNGIIVANKCKYVKEDRLLDIPVYLTDDDYIAIYEAIPRFVDEIKKVSQNQIYMYDLANNLLFDGYNLYAIDTDNYKLRSDLTEEEIYAMNIDILEYALRMEFGFVEERNKELENKIYELVKSYLPKERTLYNVKKV